MDELSLITAYVEGLLTDRNTERPVGMHRPNTSPPLHTKVPAVESDIGIITPYNAQCCEIRQQLRKAGYPAIKVGSVEEFQGQVC